MLRTPSPATLALPVLLATLGLASCGDDEDEPDAQQGALIVTSDFQSGAVSSIDLESHAVSRNVASVHSDAMCRVRGDRAYIVNRLGQDNVQVLDLADGYRTLAQFSTGNGSNPQDVCFASDEKAYVPLYASAEVLVLDPRDGRELGRVDLGSLAAGDGVPDMNACAVAGERLYVTLQNLQNFAPSGQSRMAIVDTRTDTLVRGEPLTGQNPFTAIVHDAPNQRLLFGASGDFGVQDGGIEAFDLRTERSAGFVVTEQTLEGDVSTFEYFRANRSFAIVTSAAFATSLVAFDPGQGTRLATLIDSADADPADSDFDLAAVAVNDRGELYVADADFTTPGVRILDAESGQQLVAAPLDVGLPPRGICFTE